MKTFKRKKKEKKMKERKLEKIKRKKIIIFFNVMNFLISSLRKTKLSIPLVLDPPSQIPPWNKTLEDFVKSM